MAPEQLLERKIDARSDVYAAGVVLWEMLVGKRLFDEDNQAAVMLSVLTRRIPPPSTISPRVPSSLDGITMRALQRDPSLRFQTARDMALAIETSGAVASTVKVAEWVRRLAGPVLEQRSAIVLRSESGPASGPEPSASAVNDTLHTSMSELVDGTLSRGAAVSVTMDAPRPSSRPRRVAHVVGGVVLLLAVAVLVLAAGKRLAPPRVAPVAATEARAAPSVPLAPPAPASAPITAETAQATTAPVLASARPAPSARASGRPARPAPAVPTPPRVSGDAKPCVVRPYVDDSGFTQFVKECP
jgi:serine/threonine-protein kinase